MNSQWHDALAQMDGWHFGGKGSGIEDSLLALVLDGTKTATCSWFETYAMDDEPLPTVGDRSYIMNAADAPRCIVETTEVVVQRFVDVDADFAFDEGEGDRSYGYWRRTHEAFFGAYAKTIARAWNSETEHVVCERFVVVHVFEAGETD